MHGSNHFAIVGTGAVGGYYGGLLQRAGFDVHFLMRGDCSHVRQNGLVVESPNGNFELPHVHAYDDPRDMPRCNVVAVALKTTANHALAGILPHLVKKDGMVLTLQNGLGSEDEIAGIVGEEGVVGGLCFLCSNKLVPGHIRHLDYGLITIGEYRKTGQPGGISPRLEQLASDLSTATIPVKAIEDLTLARWKKLVWNIPFNGLSVLLNELTNQLVRNPETRALCKMLMHEVAAAAAACARPIESAFIEKMMVDTEKMKPYATSMKLDFDRGSRMEIESIYGNPIRAAKAVGMAMPETEKIYQKLCSLNPPI
jgi:2-dehydropantoate 2-reductase